MGRQWLKIMDGAGGEAAEEYDSRNYDVGCSKAYAFF